MSFWRVQLDVGDLIWVHSPTMPIQKITWPLVGDSAELFDKHTASSFCHRAAAIASRMLQKGIACHD